METRTASVGNKNSKTTQLEMFSTDLTPSADNYEHLPTIKKFCKTLKTYCHVDKGKGLDVVFQQDMASLNKTLLRKIKSELNIKKSKINWEHLIRSAGHLSNEIKVPGKNKYLQVSTFIHARTRVLCHKIAVFDTITTKMRRKVHVSIAIQLVIKQHTGQKLQRKRTIFVIKLS